MMKCNVARQPCINIMRVSRVLQYGFSLGFPGFDAKFLFENDKRVGQQTNPQASWKPAIASLPVAREIELELLIDLRPRQET